MVITLDLFPALVATPYGARYDQARVIIANDELMILIAGAGGVTEVYRKPVASFEGNRIAGYSILTADGRFIANSAGGCGCGNILKSYNPFEGMTRLVS